MGPIILDKVFISLGMSGRDDKDVEKDIDRLLALYKRYTGLDNVTCLHNLKQLEPTDTSVNITENSNLRLVYLGRAIQNIGNAKVIVFAKDWKKHIGCIVEHEVAIRYNIPYFVESEDSTRLIQDYEYEITKSYTYLAYSLVSCEMGSEGYSGWGGYTICEGNNIEEVIEDYKYKNNLSHLRFDKKIYNKDTNCNTMNEFVIRDYFPIYFTKLKTDVYGSSKPLIIDFPYDRHVESYTTIRN